MPQCVSEMVQVSNLYLQRGAAKILNKALLKFGCKTTSYLIWACWIHQNELQNALSVEKATKLQFD